VITVRILRPAPSIHGQRRTDDLPTRSRMLGVGLDGSRRIEPAHVGSLVVQTSSRRMQKDRLDDHRNDQGASDSESDGKASTLVALFTRSGSFVGGRRGGVGRALPALAAQVRANLAAAGRGRITVVVGDGTLGIPNHAPYQAIVMSMASPRAPRRWSATRPRASWPIRSVRVDASRSPASTTRQPAGRRRPAGLVGGPGRP
jgi:hypothetical protein